MFWDSPCYETVFKTNQAKQPSENKKRGYKSHLLCDEPRYTLFEKVFPFVFLNSPCYKTPKNAIKKKQGGGGQV
jgi:hypothetical protein